MLQPRIHIAIAPLRNLLVPLSPCLLIRLDGFRVRHKSLRRILAPVQQHIFNQLQQRLVNLLIHLKLASVHNAHVQPGPNGVIQKRAVHGLAHGVVAAKAKADIAHPAAHFGPRQVLLNPARRLDKVHGIVVVLFDASRHRQNIRVKNNIFGGKAHLVHQRVISPLANRGLALQRVGLAALIKGHHHCARAMPLHHLGLLLKFLRPFF